MKDPNEQREGYKLTKVGWIPKSWECYKFNEICAIVEGMVDPRLPEFSILPHIGPENIEKNSGRIKHFNSCAEDGLKSGKYFFDKAHIIYSKIRPNLNKACSPNFKGLCGADCYALKPYSKLNKKFLLHSILSNTFLKQSVPASMRTGMPKVNRRDLNLFRLPVPPLLEQEKIAQILCAWDDGLIRLEAAITAKTRLKNALMQKLLTGKTRISESEEDWKSIQLSSILRHLFRPVEWHEDTLFDLVSIRRRAGGLFRRGLTKGADYKTKDLHRIEAGDLLISKRQVTHGALSVVTEEFEGGIVSKEYSIFENIAPDKLHMPFLNWLTKEKRFWWICFVASNGVDIEKLIFSPTDFLKATISLPPTIEEQAAIAKILTTAETEITLLKAKQTALQQQKKSLMQKLLTGQVRVTI